MLAERPFYWNITRKYIVAFASLFSNVQIQRMASNGTVLKDITVPITYAGKSKLFNMIQRREESKKVSTILPRISFLFTDITPDPSRKLNSTNIEEISTGDDYIEFMPNGVPYNFTIDMSVWAKNFDDLLQIVEQVGVYFQPDYTITIDEIKELGIKRDVTINMESVNIGVEAEYGVDSNRNVLADFQFTLQGMLYPPIKSEGIIKLISANFKHDDDTDKKFSEIAIDEIETVITEGV